MAPRIRVLARHSTSGDASSGFIYNAEVFDDEDLSSTSLWVCRHDHRSPGAAHQCGLGWVERAAKMLGGSESLAELRRSVGGGPDVEGGAQVE